MSNRNVIPQTPKVSRLLLPLSSARSSPEHKHRFSPSHNTLPVSEPSWLSKEGSAKSFECSNLECDPSMCLCPSVPKTFFFLSPAQECGPCLSQEHIDSCLCPCPSRSDSLLAFRESALAQHPRCLRSVQQGCTLLLPPPLLHSPPQRRAASRPESVKPPHEKEFKNRISASQLLRAEQEWRGKKRKRKARKSLSAV